MHLYFLDENIYLNPMVKKMIPKLLHLLFSKVSHYQSDFDARPVIDIEFVLV
jgi:hypothetical protein